jgi:prepilin-type N-terminal cleavage/methylation domain-containing protein
MQKHSGFTLVELLVVISIIGLLSAVLYGSFAGARDTASNRALQTELKETQLALEVYRSQNGRFPPVGGSIAVCRNTTGLVHFAFTTTAGVCSAATVINSYIGDLSPEFIAELPHATDSRNSSCEIRYEVEEDGEWYKLTAENCFAGAEDASEGIGPDEEFSQCPSSCRPVGCAGSGGGAAFDAYVGTTAFYESMAVYSFGGECQ